MPNCTAWPRGSMVFEFTELGHIDKRYVSKKNEPPSEFIARIIMDRMKDAAVIWPYLKDEMEERYKAIGMCPQCCQHGLKRRRRAISTIYWCEVCGFKKVERKDE